MSEPKYPRGLRGSGLPVAFLLLFLAYVANYIGHLHGHG